MNNDLDQFSEERLKEIVSAIKLEPCDYHAVYDRILHMEIAALARIALAAKQAKPVGNFVHTLEDGVRGMTSIPDDSPLVKVATPLYTTPQPAHTEEDGWSSNGDVNSALVMLDRIETTDPADDDRIEEIKRIIRQLTTTPVNSQVIPDGWKLVPIEPTDEQLRLMLAARYPATFREHLRNPLNGHKSRVEAEILIVEVTNQYKNALAAAPKPESE